MPLKPGRMHLTVMFTDLSDSTYLGSILDPEAYNQFLEHVRRDFGKIVSDCNGSTVRIDGDGFIFIFGEPGESNVKLAIDAALKMHAKIADYALPYIIPRNLLKLHSGIHSGRVLLKEGDLVRGKYEILGSATNVAAKLCEAAGPGEILVSKEALGRDKGLFKIIQEKGVELKGRKSAVAVFSITARNEIPSANEYGYSRFVGRESILARLQASVADRSHSSKIIMLHGEAGVGKSRLLSEMSPALSQENTQVHYSICEPGFEGSSFGPVKQLIQSMDRIKEGSKNDAKLVFSNNVVDKLDGIETRSELLTIVMSLLDRHPDKDVVFVIDDWHWVDSQTQQLIEKVCQDYQGKLTVILAARTLDKIFADINKVQIIKLNPLESDDIDFAIKNLIPGIEPFLLAHIRESSNGNPLYIEELCSAANQSGRNIDTHGPKSSIAVSVQSRLFDLSENLVTIVKAAAVIGHIVPKSQLNDVLGYQINDTQLDKLFVADLIYPTRRVENLRFKHRITRNVVYDLISLEERKNLHSKVANILAYNAKIKDYTVPHGYLAYHYGEAGDAKLSAFHSRLAGRDALQSSNLDKAQDHFCNAILQSEKVNVPLSEFTDLIRNYGLACAADPSADQTKILSSAVNRAMLAKNDDAIAWTQYWLGFNLYGLGYPDQSLRHFKLALTACETTKNEKLGTQVLAGIGEALAASCQYSSAYNFLDRAIKTKLANRSGTRSSGGLSYALSCKGFALGEQGKYDAAQESFEKATEILQNSNNAVLPSVLNQNAVVNMWKGDFDTARELCFQAKTLSRRIHSRYNYAQACFINASLDFLRFKDAHSISGMIEATSWLEFDGIGQNMSLNYSGIAEVLSQTQNWKKARIYAARGIKRARLGDRRCESQVYRALALVAKAGQCRNTPEYYLAKANLSAGVRNSQRELQNNRQFQHDFFS